MSDVTLIGICIAFFGVVALLYALYCYQRSVDAAAWPKTDGTIVSASLVHTGYADKDRGEMSRRLYEPVIEYTYTVRGRTYKGTRIVIGELVARDQAAVVEMLQPYPAGARVLVSYDPRDPAAAALETRVDGWTSFGYVSLGVFLLIIGIWMMSPWGPRA